MCLRICVFKEGGSSTLTRGSVQTLGYRERSHTALEGDWPQGPADLAPGLAFAAFCWAGQTPGSSFCPELWCTLPSGDSQLMTLPGEGVSQKQRPPSPRG